MMRLLQLMKRLWQITPEAGLGSAHNFTAMAIGALIGLLVIVVVAVFQAALSEPISEGRQVVAIELVQDAETFRTALVSNNVVLPARLVTSAFERKWSGDVAPFFSQGDEWQLVHFFGLSVITIGRVQATRAVVSFYNPWIDGVLLTSWRRDGTGWMADNFLLLSGETFRGNPVQDPENTTEYLVPEWLEREDTLLRAISAVYTETINRFETLAPLNAPFRFPIGSVPKEPLHEVLYLKTRMTARLAYPQEKFAGTPAEDIINTSVKTVQNAVAVGDAEFLRSLVAGTQGEDIAGVIVSLPQEVREAFVPNWYVSKGETVSVLLGNGVLPRLFIQIELNLSDRINALRNMAIYDLEAARRVHQSIGQ